MQRPIKLSASVICANLLNLETDIAILHSAKLDYLHFDIMDGHFVPEIGLGVFFLERLSDAQNIPIDVHLMIEHPKNYIDSVAAAGASIITVHYEAQDEIGDCLMRIKEIGLKAGIALKPETPVSAIKKHLDCLDMILLMAYPPGTRGHQPISSLEQKIGTLSGFLDSQGNSDVDVAVDGGVNCKRIRAYRSRGANFFVLGSSGLFLIDGDLEKQIGVIREALLPYDKEVLDV
jgi:ribulose-phosphate 3-epimerase